MLNDMTEKYANKEKVAIRAYHHYKEDRYGTASFVCDVKYPEANAHLQTPVSVMVPAGIDYIPNAEHCYIRADGSRYVTVKVNSKSYIRCEVIARNED